MPLAGKLFFLVALMLALASVAQAEPLFAKPANEGDVSDRSSLKDADAIEPPEAQDPTEKTPLEISSKPELTKGEWVFAPVPGYNPSQEFSLALMMQRIFAHEKDQKPSIFAGAVFGTEKKSYGGMLGYIGRLNEDKLRLNVFGGYAKINSDFYGVGRDTGERDISVLLEQKATFFSAQLMPKWGPVYLGPTIGYKKLDNKFDVPNLPAEINVNDKLDSETWVPGFKVQMDERDNSFYPTKGYLANLNLQFYMESLGNVTNFQRYKADYNYYHSLDANKVLAARAYFQANVGDVPFYDLAMFGMGSDLRGYKAGKYRDKVIWATQAEYRQRFTDHWGAVAFAGVGDVAHSVSDLELKDLLWSGGLGARYRIAARNPIDFRVDVAYGDEWSWYFSVNQAF
ncbi:BamA/TamA family outer membrane protein [Bdellovibrio sp. NC01]|uniref:BamA/TamA family outer membrane protein n=1 Tax=Bdellovibrio sp. NC01 TaxID=2220073 RepID=UPI0011576664|nr:BamA/TamA family outer membrane protein [Bdellovibrio sp. NC01]QDK37448.1 hypothetical protein DOE51_07550 [Bdellovibrio sp. NC01]